jgi:hypothetical protein
MNNNEEMQSVLEAIQGIDISEWYYYYQISKNKFENPFSGNIDHLDFIKRYFQKGGKENVLKDFDVNNFLPQRAPHTNLVFFLGIYLYHRMVFKNYIDNSLTVKGYHMFPFIWFLITLFHDFGYIYENEFDKFKHIIDIETLKKELKIKYDLLRYNKIRGLSVILFKNIKKYFLYRRYNSKYDNKIDHGILAGLFFYDSLVKNRIKQYNNNNKNDLYFGKELNKAYAQAAGVIATHNIWFPNESNKSEYNKFGLEELVVISPINLKESPLLVLLGLVDTIDPVKAYYSEHKDNKNVDINEILNNLLIFCDNRKLILKKSQDFTYDFNEIVKRANGLNGWLDLDVCSSNEHLCISLSP